ncbi:DUF1674 domain-containing protein [Glacieibacterium sp.]|uniref:DUF1674 domain-containing protein n=1 Tax=Glacieibacterium sp. TaxID=2860237 RepID=UPI003AFFADDA
MTPITDATQPSELPPELPSELPMPTEPDPEMDPSAPPKPEFGGRDGPDPVRYGDWERGGVAVDF